MIPDKKQGSDIMNNYQYAWDKYNQEEMDRVFLFSEGYKDFISKCKTERECVKEFIAMAEKNGFRDLETVIAEGGSVKPGDRLYANNMGKTLALFVIGTQPLEKGMRILGAHIDSPRLDLKQNPLYEDTYLAMLETHYYGGVKKYQWVAIPLAIHGVVVKKDGNVIEVVIGEEDDDPVVGVSDLLIHLAADQMEKKLSKGIEGEDLNICIGSIPIKDGNDGEKERVKKNILRLLNQK